MEENKEKVLLKDSQVTKMPSNSDPKMRKSCHAKFFKVKDKKVIKISYKEFIKANKLNKEWKKDLLDTHYKQGEMDEEGSTSCNRQFLTEKKIEEWTHKRHLNDEEEEEQLRDLFKRRMEIQHFTYKSARNTEEFGPFEILRNRLLLTPNINSTSKLTKIDNFDKFIPMTSRDFTKTNFKVNSISFPFSFPIPKIKNQKQQEISSQG